MKSASYDSYTYHECYNDGYLKRIHAVRDSIDHDVRLLVFREWHDWTRKYGLRSDCSRCRLVGQVRLSSLLSLLRDIGIWEWK